MRNLFESFSRYINEEQELIEGRLQDVQKKYPRLGEFVKYLSSKDPSGKNKYLPWMAKQLEKHSSTTSSDDFKKSLADTIADVVLKFHNNSKKLDKKDINQYKSLDDLDAVVSNVGPSQREKRKKEKEQAMEGSEVIYQDDDFFLVRPNTEESSCYYGKGTKWCISATDSRNYFGQYTNEKKTFYMLRNENLPADHPGHKLAFVADEDGTIDEIFDAPDDSIGEGEARDHIAANLFGKGAMTSQQQQESKNKFYELTSLMSEHAGENPAEGVDYEEELQKIQDEFNQNAEHAYIMYDYYGDEPGDVHMSAGMEIDLNTILEVYKTKWVIDPDDEEDAIEKIVLKSLDDYNVYPSNHELSNYNEGEFRYQIDLEEQQDYYGGNNTPVDRFERLASDAQEASDSYKAIALAIKERLEDAGFVEGGTYSKLKKMFQNAPPFKNVEIDIDGGKISLTIPLEANVDVAREKTLTQNDMATIINAPATSTGFHAKMKSLLGAADRYSKKQMDLFERFKPEKAVKGKINFESFVGGKIKANYELELAADAEEYAEKVYLFAQYLDKNIDVPQGLFVKLLQDLWKTSFADDPNEWAKIK